MTLFIGSIVVNVSDIERAKRFWTAALNYAVQEADAEFAILCDPTRRWSSLSLQLSPQPKQGKNRVHLDLYADDQHAEVERLVSLGAVKADWDYPPDADYIVLLDPDGNEFCIVASNAANGTNST